MAQERRQLPLPLPREPPPLRLLPLLGGISDRHRTILIREARGLHRRIDYRGRSSIWGMPKSARGEQPHATLLWYAAAATGEAETEASELCEWLRAWHWPATAAGIHLL